MESTMRGLEGFSFYGKRRGSRSLNNKQDVLISQHKSGDVGVRITRNIMDKFGAHDYVRLGINERRGIIAIIADDDLGMRLQKKNNRAYVKFSGISKLPFEVPLHKQVLTVANGLILVSYKDK